MLVDEYQAYLARFQEKVGALPVGSYGKYQGKLIRKLAPDEFHARNSEYSSLDHTYRGILKRGDTINDAIVKLLRERAAELLFPDPIA